MKSNKIINSFVGKSFCVIFLIFLSSCATPIITKAKCKNTNWHNEGVNDGASGRFMQPVDEYVAVCEKHKFFVDVQAYKDSYKNEGLPRYCTSSTGESLGGSGYGYPEICDKARFPQVNTGWKKGVKNYCVFSRGQSDASMGMAERTLCSEYSAYAKGWQQGALDFCVPRKGFELGKAGKVVSLRCPASVAVPFNAAYDEGIQLKARIDLVKKQISKLKSEISSLEEKIKKANTVISKNNDDIRMYPNNINNDRLLQENFAKHNDVDAYRLDVVTKRNSIDTLNYELRNLESRSW